MIDPARIHVLNSKPVCDGRYVVYWMQQSQRAEHNDALDYACDRARELSVPVIVVFGVSPSYREAQIRHYHFMIQGLQETYAHLAQRHIPLYISSGEPPEIACVAAQKASILVCDRGYLRHQRSWRTEVAQKIPCEMIEIESDTIVPVESASPKQESAARTFRPKFFRSLPTFRALTRCEKYANESVPSPPDNLILLNPDAIPETLSCARDAGIVNTYRGGTTEGKRLFSNFLDTHLPTYTESRKTPARAIVSHMSMYLHFGQISPRWLLDMVEKRREHYPEEVDSFCDELCVQRELAINYVYYNPQYDCYDGLPEWARKTLEEHVFEKSHIYSVDELERCNTHDPYWNAAMSEMILTGYMHNYMRMYWGKKICQWAPSPHEGFAMCLYLNNKWFIDGRDPLSYANCGWIFGVHDHPWPQQKVFGAVRSMTAGGLKRKCDIEAYVQKIHMLSSEA